MSLHVALSHQTRYTYDRPINLGPQVIRLRPAAHSRTAILSYSLHIEPDEYFINWQQDPFGNFLARVVFPEKVTRFQVDVDLVADMVVQNPFDFFLDPGAEEFPFAYDAALLEDLRPYLKRDASGPLLEKWVAGIDVSEPRRTVDFLVDVNRHVQQHVAYVIRLEPGVQTPEETLDRRVGSCRDSSWLLVQVLRHLGIASRFVSGYLIQLVPDVKPLDGPAGPDADFTDLHAWVEAYVPGAGWIGLDPTSGLFAGEGHIPLAATPHPSSAAPITGTLDDCETVFDHEMRVERILESPRVTKPYDEATWQSIDDLGAKIYADLQSDGVSLTIGGEPTFVAADEPDAPEWNTEATGTSKRARGTEMIKRLRDRFAPGGLLHFGQGKWYPGEQLPRWAFSLYWRRDGVPIWSDDDLIGDGSADAAVDFETSHKFLTGVADRLGVEAEAVSTVYEDPWHFISAERHLPDNVNPLDNKLEDPLARERLARVFERGLGEPAGAILPIQRWNARDGSRRWTSEPWSTRPGKLFLIPGDSPVGFRLPVPSLPFIEPTEYPYILPADPFATPAQLPDPLKSGRQPYRQRLVSSPTDEAAPQALTGQVFQQGDRRIVRAALAVEIRSGEICAFMPPVKDVADYLDIIAAIEDTASEMAVPIRIEGYDPPKDPQVNVIRVTPDPGVLEVNVHPARSWQELREITEGIYDDAYNCRLAAEKFMLDGRHTGTGGGNHIVLGGARVDESPFLRRPDLLKSLVSYWQHHPSLSYLFSGLFIGPTSQAPRVDEARHDSLHELELAFSQLPEISESVQPWLVDRLFRNLLIDVTGNTHRAEICIDKLYSPDGPTGRLGLVEFRAFEMTPHSRMNLAQQLLMLALIARFWREPYGGRLIRWGTRLHDQFMLPEYVWQDFATVLDEMRSAGFPLQDDWYAPHFEFRFPRYGSVQYGQIEVEIRSALEPWHVMGESGGAGGTVRYVDSSVERLQVKVTGLAGERFEIACNGARVPLSATIRPGEYVGGVRFRAWQPSTALHPTIPIDAPLIFDVYDTWTGRAVAGCTYHTAHPGGRNFEQFPVNAFEAESRRQARFAPIGHSVGPAPRPREIANPEFPHTLDLRWTH